MLRNPIYSYFSGQAGDTRVRGRNFSGFLTLGCNLSVKQQKRRGAANTSPSSSSSCSFLSPAAVTPLLLRRKGTHSTSRGQGTHPHRQGDEQHFLLCPWRSESMHTMRTFLTPGNHQGRKKWNGCVGEKEHKNWKEEEGTNNRKRYRKQGRGVWHWCGLRQHDMVSEQTNTAKIQREDGHTFTMLEKNSR